MFIVIESCKHEPMNPVITDDPGDDDDNDTTLVACDPDTVYFVNELLPLLTSTCARSGCHDAVSARDGVILTDYASIMATADVRPGNPTDSDLYEVLVETDPDKRMPPPPNSALSTGQIQLVFSWIQQGAQNLECTQAGCDLENVTFSQTVVNNLQNNGCINCHSGSSPSGGVSLGNHSNVSQVAQSGRLMGAIRRLDGFAAMPPSGDPMGECQTDQIQKWIDDGTPNN
jgi:cytochrome c5